jgi:hypothetical protein
MFTNFQTAVKLDEALNCDARLELMMELHLLLGESPFHHPPK